MLTRLNKKKTHSWTQIIKILFRFCLKPSAAGKWQLKQSVSVYGLILGSLSWFFNISYLLTLLRFWTAEEFSSNLASSCVAMERTLLSRSSPSSPAGRALWQDSWIHRGGQQAGEPGWLGSINTALTDIVLFNSQLCWTDLCEVVGSSSVSLGNRLLFSFSMVLLRQTQIHW